MNTKYQRYWNKRIRGFQNPANIGGPMIARIAREGGPFWTYEQDPHNTDAFKEGWERTYGKRDDIGSNLANKGGV